MPAASRRRTRPAALAVLAVLVVSVVLPDPRLHSRRPESARANILPATLPEISPAEPALVAGPPRNAPASAAARIAAIARDYDELRAQTLAELRAEGDREAMMTSALARGLPSSPAALATRTAFPGGAAAAVRMLALLERERHADLAAALSLWPRDWQTDFPASFPDPE